MPYLSSCEGRGVSYYSLRNRGRLERSIDFLTSPALLLLTPALVSYLLSYYNYSTLFSQKQDVNFSEE